VIELPTAIPATLETVTKFVVFSTAVAVVVTAVISNSVPPEVVEILIVFPTGAP